MTSKIITGTYSAGYLVSPGVTDLEPAASAYIGGTGIGAAKSLIVENLGRVLAGAGEAGGAGHYLGVAGHTGVDLAAGGSVNNFNTIVGGIGGAGGANGSNRHDYAGGAGGAAVVFSASGSIVNHAGITGGAGGAGGGGGGGYGTPRGSGAPGGVGGAGGDAINLLAGGSIDNGGTVTGGQGGAGGYIAATGGSGGAGISLSTGAVTNDRGMIVGGAGGTGGLSYFPGSLNPYEDYDGGIGGHGGAGVSLGYGSSTNLGGTIVGGQGGTGGKSADAIGGAGGAGGDGVDLLTGGQIVSNGTILGGAGGTGGDGDVFTISYLNYGGEGGAGGVGIDLIGTGTLANYGAITGGAGGHNGATRYARFTGAGGDGVDLRAGGAIANLGTIEGGKAYFGNGDGVQMFAGGTLTNGDSLDRTALIVGRVLADGDTPISVANFGTIAEGIYLSSGSVVQNNGTIMGGVADPKGSATLMNIGVAAGGAGAYGTSANYKYPTLGNQPGEIYYPALPGGPGGAAIGFAGGGITNSGNVTGGRGGPGGYGGVGAAGGVGGVAVNLGTLSGALSNSGILVGGAGGAGGFGGFFPAGGFLGGTGAAGGAGAVLHDAGVVFNVGTILGGAGGAGGAGGTAVNLGNGTTPPGGDGGAGGVGGDGVDLFAGGSLVNAGMITGGAGGLGGAGGAGYDGGASGLAGTNGAVGNGVLLAAGGVLTNGSTISASALISGGIGVYAQGAGATVINYGTIAGATDSVKFGSSADVLIVGGGGQFIGAVLGDGGTLQLASGTGTIGGLGGAFSDFASYVVEAGGNWTLTGSNSIASGQSLQDDGTLTVTGSIVNAGHIAIANGASFDVGGALGNSGLITLAASSANTSLLVAGALTLTGGGDILMGNNADNIIVGSSASAVLTNVSNIIAGAGDLGDGELTLINEAGGEIASNQASAQLVIDTGANTVVNSGLIEAGGDGLVITGAVDNTGYLKADGGNLTVEAAVSGTGLVVIAGGILRFESSFNQEVSFQGAGRGVLALAQSVNYTGFIAGFSTTGVDSLDLGDIAFVSAGEASFSGTTSGGVLTVTDGADTARIRFEGNYTGVAFTAGSDGAGGTTVTVGGPKALHWLNPVNGAFQTAADWTNGVEPGPGNDAILDAAGSTTYTVTASTAQTVAGIQTASTAILGVTSAFTATDGTDGGVNAGRIAIGAGGTFTAGGSLDNTGLISFTASSSAEKLEVAGGLSLTGGGEIFLSASANDIIVGSSTSATLTNVSDVIAGGGELGDGELTLINEAGGKIESEEASSPMVINTGANTIINAGLIESAGAGSGAVIVSPIANSGTLKADGGNLTVDGAVTGSGGDVVYDGTLRCNAAFSQNVTFEGTSGTLYLAQSAGYAGAISGFSTTGANSLDLGDIGFVNGGEATFSGTTSGGVLTVTDGTHTAHIHLTGNYTASSFVASADGHGGTIVVDPTATPTPSIHHFITAAASLGGGVGGAIHSAESRGLHEPMLAMPRTASA